MVRTSLAILVAAVINFMWGWGSWSVFGWHQPETFENPDAVVEVLKANAPDHGIYAYPAWDPQADPAAAETQWKEGPYIFATVRPNPAPELSMQGTMIKGFIISILAASALVLLIQKSGHSTFVDRVSVALLAGLFLGIVSALYPWNWLESPGLHTIGLLADGIIPWTIAGAAIAMILPPKEPV